MATGIYKIVVPNLKPESETGNFVNIKIELNQAIVRCKNLEIYLNKFYGKVEN